MESITLEALCDHSVNVGSQINLVQASGGNTSWKNGSNIWVKASGKRLKDAHIENIFSQLKIDTITDFEVLNSDTFDKYCLGDLMPSIELNFHLLIKNSIVTHLHSFGAIALGISVLSDDEISYFESQGIVFVSYARPGVELVKKINQSLGNGSSIFLLENHGVIFSSESFLDLERNISNFERIVHNFFSNKSPQVEYPDWIKIITSGVLTPDEGVFLGFAPFQNTLDNNENTIEISSMGEVIFPKKITKDRLELAKFYIGISKFLSKKVQIRYLPQKEVLELLDWDREKLRIEMAR